MKLTKMKNSDPVYQVLPGIRKYIDYYIIDSTPLSTAYEKLELEDLYLLLEELTQKSVNLDKLGILKILADSYEWLIVEEMGSIPPKSRATTILQFLHKLVDEKLSKKVFTPAYGEADPELIGFLGTLYDIAYANIQGTVFSSTYHQLLLFMLESIPYEMEKDLPREQLADITREIYKLPEDIDILSPF